MKILYVEDNEINAMVVDLALQRAGHTIHLACSPAEALDRVTENFYELILMDIDLGVADLNGTELMYLIKKEFSYYEQIPFFALTAAVVNDDGLRFLQAGFDRFFAKPIDIPRLIASIESYPAYP